MTTLWRAALLIGFVLVSPYPARAQTPSPEAARVAFDALLERAKKADPALDFGELRLRFAESDRYKAYADEQEEAMISAIVSDRPKEALDIVRDILGRNYMNLEAHFTGALACNALNDTPCSAQHLYMARGIVGSILASGDGNSQNTAFRVISTSEELAVVRVLGVLVQDQRLLRDNDGHSFDELSVVDGKTGERRKVYFGIDLALAAVARSFGI